MNTFFDFNTGKSFNPLEDVKTFFVNPLMPQSAEALGLQDKLMFATRLVQPEDGKYGTTITFHKGIPCIQYKIQILNLGKVFVYWSEKYAGQIHADSTRIYFRIVDDGVMRIDTVLHGSGSNTLRDKDKAKMDSIVIELDDVAAFILRHKK